MNLEEILKYKTPIPEHYNFVDKTGMRSGKLNILFYAGTNFKGKTQFAAKCDCGNHILVLTSNLAETNRKTNCGCSPKRKSVKQEQIDSRIKEVELKTSYKVINSGQGGYDNLWKFLCEAHGEFTARWGKVAREGTRCPACMFSCGGFDQTKDGVFYLNEVLDLEGNLVALKFGITNFTADKRLKEIETKSIYSLKNIYFREFEKGTDALLLERAFSKEFGKRFLNKSEMQRGFTETVDPSFKQSCLIWLDKLSKENK